MKNIKSYCASIRSGSVLGRFAFRVRVAEGDPAYLLAIAGPKIWRKQAIALGSKFQDPVDRALFVESFCRTAHQFAEAAK